MSHHSVIDQYRLATHQWHPAGTCFQTSFAFGLFDCFRIRLTRTEYQSVEQTQSELVVVAILSSR